MSKVVLLKNYLRGLIVGNKIFRWSFLSILLLGVVITVYLLLQENSSDWSITQIIFAYLLFCVIGFVLLVITFYLWSIKRIFWDKNFLLKIALILFILFLVTRMFHGNRGYPF